MSACTDELCGWTTDVPVGGFLIGYVWWCGDEYCDCTRPEIQRYERDGSMWKRNVTTLWEGTFQSDGEGFMDAGEWKDAPKSTTELNRMAQHLRRHHHDLYRRIVWPWNGTKGSN